MLRVSLTQTLTQTWQVLSHTALYICLLMYVHYRINIVETNPNSNISYSPNMNTKQNFSLHTFFNKNILICFRMCSPGVHTFQKRKTYSLYLILVNGIIL